jgi:tryptophan-rich sensory protein
MTQTVRDASLHTAYTDYTALPPSLRRRRTTDWWTLVVLIGCTSVAALLGGVGAPDAGQVYALLNKPDWAPPGWLFGPAWTVLYLMLAVAVWLGLRDHGVARSRVLLTLFALQLVANAMWNPVFFTVRSGLGAMMVALVLWLLVVALMGVLARRRTAAVLLLVPYLAWVTFAVVLTWAVWQRNPDTL